MSVVVLILEGFLFLEGWVMIVKAGVGNSSLSERLRYVISNLLPVLLVWVELWFEFLIPQCSCSSQANAWSSRVLSSYLAFIWHWLLFLARVQDSATWLPWWRTRAPENIVPCTPSSTKRMQRAFWKSSVPALGFWLYRNLSATNIQIWWWDAGVFPHKVNLWMC